MCLYFSTKIFAPRPCSFKLEKQFPVHINTFLFFLKSLPLTYFHVFHSLMHVKIEGKHLIILCNHSTVFTKLGKYRLQVETHSSELMVQKVHHPQDSRAIVIITLFQLIIWMVIYQPECVPV